MSSDFLSFLPLLTESIDTVRARLDADANAGLVATDPAFIDLTEGGFYFDLTQPAALEAERLWDYASSEVPAALFLTFAWGDYLDEHGVVLGVPRKDAVAATGTVRFVGTDGTVVSTGAQVAQPATDPDTDPIVFATTTGGTIASGILDLPIAASETGTSGNVAAGTITTPLTSISGVTSINNAAATSGGSDVESDDSYRARLLLEYRTTAGAGTVTDYEQWALAYPGVGAVTVEPLWAGAGTVRVVITDSEHNPSSSTTIDGLQALLDPVPGEGRGLAPIGAIVTVATVSPVTITVSATVTHSQGYSLTGTGGTTATHDEIVAAIESYINSLDPGDDVIVARVEAQFFTVEGVYDVHAVTLGPSPDSNGNVVLTTLQVAQTSGASITLS